MSIGQPALPQQKPRFRFRGRYLSPNKESGAQLIVAYLLLLGVSAWIAHWTPEYLAGRSLWHFAVSRMLVPMLALGVFAAWARLIPSALFLSALLLLVGTASAIKREATGEPFQLSDLFLAGQGTSLFGYVSWDRWLIGSAVLPVAIIYARYIRVRIWSVPLFLGCIALLSTYRIEAVVRFIHDHAAPWGIEDLPFNQAESERMNGLATHLYFSTAGLRLTQYTPEQVETALASLVVPDVPLLWEARKPDIYVVLGEAWWRDPSDMQSPLKQLVDAGFLEATAISPVYGGNTPNAEFEVLTGIPMHTFKAGIIPYQHYIHFFRGPQTLPRVLGQQGYTPRAFHNHDSRFWLRDQVYPRFGFASFDSVEGMNVTRQANGWAKDDGLYAKDLERETDPGPEFHFLVTVATHGPYIPDPTRETGPSQGVHDYRDRLRESVNALLDFERELRRRGRPFVLLVFGDHLPGLRLHQLDIGFTSDADPRFHQVPVLISTTEPDAAELRDILDGRPLYCIGPSITSWLKLAIEDRYFRYLSKTCRDKAEPDVLPPEPVVQHQLFDGEHK